MIHSRIVNIGVFITFFVVFYLCFSSVQEGFLKTFGPFEEVKIQYKWRDTKSNMVKCVAKAPGEEAMPCFKKSATELSEYKLIWKIPEKEIARVAYTNED